MTDMAFMENGNYCTYGGQDCANLTERLMEATSFSHNEVDHAVSCPTVPEELRQRVFEYIGSAGAKLPVTRQEATQ